MGQQRTSARKRRDISFGSKLTSWLAVLTSALGQKQTSWREHSSVCFGPEANLNGDADYVRLGARATETEIKRLSVETGEERLSNYRIVHFATHGTLAGQPGALGEPGPILPPPASASDENDGYLSASEITQLKLDADWVVLSACNTAGPSKDGAEALSGLARAFFYAQARSVLVSQWEVDSHSTVALITATMKDMAANARIGRAQSLQRAIGSLIDHGQLYQSHPTYWVCLGRRGRLCAQLDCEIGWVRRDRRRR